MRVEYGAVTTANRTAGLSVNEDAFLVPGGVYQAESATDGVHDTQDRVLFAVSDGIHCSPGARTASRTLLEQLAAIHAENPGAPPRTKLAELHERFTELVAEDRGRIGMTATLAVVELVGERATIYHVGDSCAWLIRSGYAERLTRDHTTLQRMIEEGDISRAEAEGLASIYDGLDRYFSAMPGEDKPLHDQLDVQLESGDILLLASDGIEPLGGAEIAHFGHGEPAAIAQGLLSAAVHAGSEDNMTVLAIRVTD